MGMNPPPRLNNVKKTALFLQDGFPYLWELCWVKKSGRTSFEKSVVLATAFSGDPVNSRIKNPKLVRWHFADFFFELAVQISADRGGTRSPCSITEVFAQAKRASLCFSGSEFERRESLIAKMISLEHSMLWMSALAAPNCLSLSRWKRTNLKLLVSNWDFSPHFLFSPQISSAHFTILLSGHISRMSWCAIET